MVLARYEDQWLHLMLVQEHLELQSEKKQPKSLMSISIEDTVAILVIRPELHRQAEAEKVIQGEGSYIQSDILNKAMLYL